MRMEDSLIDVKQLSCKVGTKYLLNQINWKVNKGEQWVIFGLNGSGKTTLLSIIAGYRPYNKGSVKVFGESLSEDSILKIRKKIGWVSSSFFDNYYKNESALEIILSGKTGTLGMDFSIDESDVKRAKVLLRQFGLENKCNMPFCTLSKGERQNILLVRAIFNQPEILILDEPCSGLDIVARENVLRMVRQIAQNGNTTMVYVTHYAEELLEVFTNIMLLKKGKVFVQGTMEECMKSEHLSAFLEQPAQIVVDETKHIYIQFQEGMNANDSRYEPA